MISDEEKETIRYWVRGYGIVQEFDNDDAVNMITSYLSTSESVNASRLERIKTLEEVKKFIELLDVDNGYHEFNAFMAGAVTVENELIKDLDRLIEQAKSEL